LQQTDAQPTWQKKNTCNKAGGEKTVKKRKNAHCSQNLSSKPRPINLFSFAQPRSRHNQSHHQNKCFCWGQPWHSEDVRASATTEWA